MSKGLDPDQDRRSVGPDLGPICLQRLSADDKVDASKEIVKLAPLLGYIVWQLNLAEEILLLS